MNGPMPGRRDRHGEGRGGRRERQRHGVRPVGRGDPAPAHVALALHPDVCAAGAAVPSCTTLGLTQLSVLEARWWRIVGIRTSP